MVDLCFLYQQRTLKAVRQHWSEHHGLLGLTQLANIPRFCSWKSFKLDDEPVFFSSHKTRWPEVVRVSLSVDHGNALKPELVESTARFLNHPEMKPAEVIIITLTEDLSGAWYLLAPEYPQEVFESIRFNCDEDVQQLRVIGPQFAAEFAKLSETSAPYCVKSWLDKGYLWLDFDWPCHPTPPAVSPKGAPQNA